MKNTTRLNSHESLVEAIKTAPLPYEYGEVRFVATEEKVMAGTHGKLVYPNKEGGISSSYDGNIFPTGALSASIFQGGCIQRFSLEVRGEPPEQESRDVWLSSFLENHYKIDGCDLWFSSIHHTGYNEGESPDSRIVYTNGGMFRLDIGNKLSKDQRRQLKEWFLYLSE